MYHRWRIAKCSITRFDCNHHSCGMTAQRFLQPNSTPSCASTQLFLLACANAFAPRRTARAAVPAAPPVAWTEYWPRKMCKIRANHSIQFTFAQRAEQPIQPPPGPAYEAYYTTQSKQRVQKGPNHCLTSSAHVYSSQSALTSQPRQSGAEFHKVHPKIHGMSTLQILAY